jgi:hypothetical protein
MNVNKLGRFYHSGKALHIDLQGLIIDRCLRYGGDQIICYLPVQFKALGISGNTVAKIWRNYCFNDRRTSPLARGGDYSSSISSL